MSTINHTITVLINSIDYTNLLLKDSLYIRTSIANKGDIASFIIHDDTNVFVPLDWDKVVILVNGVVVFGGYIINRQVTGIGAGNNKIVHWSIECKDWTILLEQTIVNASYNDTADAYIIDDLFIQYFSTEDFDTISQVTTVNSDIDITFENITFREALNQLAAKAKANWHIAPNKTIYWYSPTSPANAVFDIDTATPDNITSFDVVTDSIKYTVDSNTIINRVRIIGGEEERGKVSDTFIADGTQRRFGPLTAKPGSIWRISYTVDNGIGGNVTRYIYPSAIGYEPEDSLIIDGGDYNVLVNLLERYIIISEAGSVVPKATTIVDITYYKLETVDITVDDPSSQSNFDRVFEQVIYDESFNTITATAYAENILDEYAWGRESVSFDVTEYGLLPGRLITINSPTITRPFISTNALMLENNNEVLLEDDFNYLMSEKYGGSLTFLIQEVTLRPVVTGSNQFMVITSVSCGKYIPTLFDSLTRNQQFSAGTGKLPARRTIGSLDKVSNNLGEIVAGRATFTDGGTAPFTWSNYADHTGVVIGLEDTGATPYGAMYILHDGTVKAKVGRMDGLTSIGGVTPSGWGIWTENGYFSGVIAASQMIGGTISTTTMPINSSNPGVYITSAGLYAYGTLGLTFALPTDPAQRPIFSSGTILNTVYEVTTSSILRTGTVNPRIQIDNSGIFAYDTGGTLRFSVDATTGRLTASQGIFSGTVTASTVTASTITGGTVTGAVFTGGTVTQGTISAATISGGTVTGGLVSGGTVSGAIVTGGTIQSASGNVYLDSLGVNLVSTGSYSYGDQRNIKWRSSVGGSITVELAASWNGTFAESWLQAGYPNFRYGIIHQTAYNNIGFGYTELQQYPTQWTWLLDGNPKFQIDSNINAYANVIPDSSTNNRQLGDSTHGFRYLYLKDDNGNVRRISINTSGILTVT